MTRTEKEVLVDKLTQRLQDNPNFMVLNLAGMDAAATNNLRRKCYEQEVNLQMVKNKLIIKALERLEGDYDDLYTALTNSSSLLFVGESPKESAKMIKELKGEAEVPDVKAAYIEQTPFVGEGTLESLAKFKSKTDLLGEVISLLQSPMQNVVSSLQGGGPNKIAGLVKALEDRQAADE